MATLFLLVIYAAFISLGLPDALLGVAWPVMQPEFAVPFSAAGIISMVISGGTIVSSLLSGKILARFGTGRVTVVSVTMTAVALLGFGLAPAFFWLILLAIPLGLGAGSVDSGLNDYVARHYEARHMSWLHCFWGLGAMLGPVIISQYIQDQSWRNGYLTVSIIQCGLVAILFFTLPVWEKVAKQSPKHSPEPEDEPHIVDIPKGVFYPLQVNGVKTVLMIFLFYCGIEATMGLWGSSFLVKIKGLDVATAAQWVSFFYGSITLGRFISGFVTVRMSSESLIRIGEIGILLGVILLILPLPTIFSLISFILIGLGCAPIFPSMLHETPARFGREDAPMIMGFQMAVAYTGATFLPPIFGVIASGTTFALMPAVFLLYIGVMVINSERINNYIKLKRA
ncbi:MFS transporter [Phototrophicus methaneseepsis]|uniref:MFS transporter n=1 Tax=Phototrophicus methaneseepsis TaxID=2710758 RepID=A0A7S8E579_9CHLR|nr:MFS transporter [Phototrophicus methaneseepsis]QPC80613.1 MFS transporter [Phototrophicus methaneseepsis]